MELRVWVYRQNVWERQPCAVYRAFFGGGGLKMETTVDQEWTAEG